MPRNDGFHRITNVSRPTLTLFPAPRKAGAAAAPAMIVCRGGGYGYTVIDKEGTEIAAWLNSAGFSALVLKYRTPNNRAGALQDAQRALSLARERAAEWNLDPQRLGIIGFSAGGHLAARTSTSFGERSYPDIDAIDENSCRPDFAVLVSPAYLDDKAGGVFLQTLAEVSAEDCWGILTAEVKALHDSYEFVNDGKQVREHRGRIFISKAVIVMCAAKKNRDADHLQNFV